MSESQNNGRVCNSRFGRIFVTREGFEIRCLRVSDNSGSVNVSVWGKIGLELESGDICEAKNCYCNNWRNQLTLYIGKNGQLLRVGELMFAFQSQPYMSLIDFSNQSQTQNADNPNNNSEINAENRKDSKNEK
ncbi:MAG: SOSS complex subunit B1 [Marteilia pararefringens]